MHENKIGPYLTPHMETDLKWSKDLYKRPEGTKLEGNIGKMLLDIGIGNDFFRHNPKYKQQNKNDKWNYFKLRIFCTANVTISKMKRQTVEFEKIFVNHLSA